MTATQTCPRRMSGLGPWERAEDLDEWRSGGGIIGQERIGLSCSFCGSLHPDRFMELVGEGWVVGPTDKSYKAYLSKPLTADEVADRKRQWLTSDGVTRAIREAGERDGKTAGQIEADIEHEWTTIQAPLLLSAGIEAKFYYQHLSDDQQAEFIELYNEHQMVVGWPGHLYTLPFFCRRTPESAAEAT